MPHPIAASVVVAALVIVPHALAQPKPPADKAPATQESKPATEGMKSTPELNRFLQELTAAHPMPSPGQKAVRILYAAQVGVSPPTFALFTNVTTTLHFSYERFLKNRLREKFGFLGTPIRLQLRKRKH
jgi:predicted GTPase